MRAIWSGAVSFGLVNIPVKIYSGSEERELKFHLLHKEDMSPIRYAKICEKEGKEVLQEDIVKGYEYSEGDYVVMTDKDFSSVNVRKTKTIDIVDFAQAEEIDPKFFEAPYYLEPGKGAEKPYTLLREALKKSNKVGVGKFVLRQKEVLCTIKADGDVLILDRLRFSEQIRSPEGLKIPHDIFVSEKEIDLALRLIDELSGPFKPEEYKDTFTEELKDVIQHKIEGKEMPVHGEEPVPTKVTDLMEILRASLDKQKKTKAHESS